MFTQFDFSLFFIYYAVSSSFYTSNSVYLNVLKKLLILFFVNQEKGEARCLLGIQGFFVDSPKAKYMFLNKTKWYLQTDLVCNFLSEFFKSWLQNLLNLRFWKLLKIVKNGPSVNWFLKIYVMGWIISTIFLPCHVGQHWVICHSNICNV